MFRLNKYKKFEEKLELPIPKELRTLYDRYSTIPIEEKRFNYKGFGTFQFLTPSEIMNESYILPNTVDEVWLLNRCWALKKEGKISEEHDKHIRANSFNDPLLISYDFRNNLFTKVNPNFEIKHTIPFARNLTNNREYLFLGYSESKILKGVYLFATNEYHSEYPIFIEADVMKILSEENFESFTHKLNYNFLDVIEKRIDEKYRFEIRNIIIYPDIEELQYDYEEYEKQKKIDKEYLSKYLLFLSTQLKETFGKENQLTISEEYLEFKISKSGLDFQFKLPIKLGENPAYLMKIINNELNLICHYNRRFRPEYYGFYNFKTYTGCIHVNHAIELLKEGILDREIFHSLPLRAFTPLKRKTLTIEILELIEKEGWDENKIQSFLNDFT